MADEVNTSYTRKRLQRNIVTSVISITLVLFIFGVIGVMYINASWVSQQVKESLSVSVFLKDTASEADIIRMQKSMNAKSFIEEAIFVNKEEAARQFEQELGEEFTRFLGSNPLPNTIDLKLDYAYANADSIEALRQRWIQNPAVEDVFYHQDLISLINNNIRKISLVISGFALLLLVISITLINNTIRMQIYSRRTSIHTMQMVGATDGFIKKPFIIQSIFHGLISASLAILMLSLSLWYVEARTQGLIHFEGFMTLVTIIFFTGVLISGLAANFAVGRYLKMSKEDLYQ